MRLSPFIIAMMLVTPAIAAPHCTFKHDDAKHEWKAKNLVHRGQWLTLFNRDGLRIFALWVPENGSFTIPDLSDGFPGEKVPTLPPYTYWICADEQIEQLTVISRLKADYCKMTPDPKDQMCEALP